MIDIVIIFEMDFPTFLKIFLKIYLLSCLGSKMVLNEDGDWIGSFPTFPANILYYKANMFLEEINHLYGVADQIVVTKLICS